MENLKVTIIGLGLIGGSLAKALNQKAGITDITAVSRSMQPIKNAIDENAIKRGFCDLNDFVYSSDIIFICTPIKQTIKYLELLKDRVKKDCIITDVGSTKSVIIHHVNSMPKPINFIGGHPMAGSEAAGFSSSYPHLFENAYYILTPCVHTISDSMFKLEKLIQTLGAIPIQLDADDHDFITANISHIPHIAAAALVNTVSDSENNSLMNQLAAGGFKDTTRIASSSPEVWQNIITTNKIKVRKVLKNYINILKDFVDLLDNDNADGIYNFFSNAKTFRDSFTSHNKTSNYQQIFEITLNVVDEPGIIGDITSLLGTNRVNIKNINVSNSREFENGCLKITLSDKKSFEKAMMLLCSRGYKVFKQT